MSHELIVREDITGLNRFSYSKLSSIWQCPYLYDLSYNYGKRGEQNCFAECGSFVHEILEKYLKGDLLQCELKDYFLQGFAEAVPDGVKLVTSNGFSVDLTEKYLSQISEFLEDFDGFSLNDEKLEVIGIEKQFTYVIEVDGREMILTGILDVIAKDSHDNYYIIDHKSKAGFSSEEERSSYAKQLYIYSIYVKEKYGKFPKAILFDMFRIHEMDVIPFKEEDFESALTWIVDTVQKISNEELFLPVDFSGELEEFAAAKAEYDNLPYSYNGREMDAATKVKYRETKKNLEDKLFFCMNLCNHRELCDAWKQAQGEYKTIMEE